MMLWRVGRVLGLALLLAGCSVSGVAHPRVGMDVTPSPADSSRKHGHEFEDLALSAVIVLLLIPVLARKRQ